MPDTLLGEMNTVCSEQDVKCLCSYGTHSIKRKIRQLKEGRNISN